MQLISPLRQNRGRAHKDHWRRVDELASKMTLLPNAFNLGEIFCVQVRLLKYRRPFFEFSDEQSRFELPCKATISRAPIVLFFSSS
jgi:hypothetical protein